MNLSIKLLSIFTILALSGFIFVNAATEDTINATVTFQQIAITASDGTISYGTLAASASQDTVTLTDTQTITNTGNVAEDFDVKGLDPTTGGSCTHWTMSADDSPGANEYAHEWSITGGSGDDWNVFTSTYEEFASNKAEDATAPLDLKITMPTTSDCMDAQNVDVTVLASAH
jgi:hypothetical protein